MCWFIHKTMKEITMNRWLTMAAVCLTAVTVFAEKSTVLDEEDVWKLYTMPSASITELDGEDAPLFGLSIGTILNEQLYFGLTGKALVEDNEGDNAQLKRWSTWYAGVEAGYILLPEALIHPTIYCIAGGGELTLEDLRSDDNEGFAVVEPGLNLGVNLWNDVELGVGVSYRWINGVNVDGGIDDDDLSDVSYNAYLRVTEF